MECSDKINIDTYYFYMSMKNKPSIYHCGPVQQSPYEIKEERTSDVN